MNYDEWVGRYRPKKNPFNKDADYNGCLFETYGDEYSEVCKAGDRYIWTLLDSDVGGAPIINADRHYAGRLGYFICEKPWVVGDEYVEER